MGWDAEDAQARVDAMTPEEIERAEREWEEYEADLREQDDEEEQ